MTANKTITVFLDLGNFSSKIAYLKENGEFALLTYSSIVHRYKEMDSITDVNHISFDGRDYYIGKGAEHFYFGRNNEKYSGNKSKGHKEGEIRFVNALHLVHEATKAKKFNIVLTSPFENVAQDKKYFEDKMKGFKSAFIDGNPFEFEVKRIIAAPEGLGAIHFTKHKNCVIIDAGSMTINILHIIGGAISMEDSHTEVGGTVEQSEIMIAEKILKIVGRKLNLSHPLVITGGKAESIKTALKAEGFTNVEVAKPSDREVEQFFVNCLGLLLEYGEQFEEVFNTND